VKIEVAKNNSKNKELLPQIVDRIFSICRNDPTFHLKNEMEIVENRMTSLQKKISKQDYLLEQSNELTNDLIQRIQILENQNERKQIELLESLGSEL
jgi:hypothetical protein